MNAMNPGTSALPGEIFGRWGHSFEEDSAGVTVYRPENYPFPRARGRAGIEFQPDGQFIEWSIGRGDAPQGVSGHWHLVGPNQVLITFENDMQPNQILEIQEVAADVLKVRRRPA